MTTRSALIAWCSVLAATLPACNSDPASPVPRTSLVAVNPQGGATGVATTAVVTMQFDHPMATGMAVYASMHEGDATGPLVPCTATWSADSMTLTMKPASPLHSGTHYTIHIGGGMRDASGDPIDMSEHGPMMGGDWADGAMMTGGGTMNGQHDEMGPGWQGPNGVYGMTFTFTTS